MRVRSTKWRGRLDVDLVLALFKIAFSMMDERMHVDVISCILM